MPNNKITFKLQLIILNNSLLSRSLLKLKIYYSKPYGKINTLFIEKLNSKQSKNTKFEITSDIYYILKFIKCIFKKL